MTKKKPAVKVLEQKGNKLSFNVSGISLSMINTLRRIILSEIPVMAIEKVTFYENSSILNDEFLAHRVGLVPIKTDLKTYNSVSQCDCAFKGCAKCTAILSLEAKGPGTVYSKQLKSNDPKIMPSYDSIPLVKLTSKQALKFEATAQIGIAKDHVKWQAALASYEILNDGSFNFLIESYGQLPPKEIVSQAFKIFNDKISKLGSLLK